MWTLCILGLGLVFFRCTRRLIRVDLALDMASRHTPGTTLVLQNPTAAHLVVILSRFAAQGALTFAPSGRPSEQWQLPQECHEMRSLPQYMLVDRFSFQPDNRFGWTRRVCSPQRTAVASSTTLSQGSIPHLATELLRLQWQGLCRTLEVHTGPKSSAWRSSSHPHPAGIAEHVYGDVQSLSKGWSRHIAIHS